MAPTCFQMEAMCVLILCVCSFLTDEVKAVCTQCCCWVIAQVRATYFSAYYSDSVPTAAYSAAVKWRVCLHGALLIFTDGNNGPMVMNGAAWWETRSNMRSGRENGVFPDDYPAIKLGLLHVWPIKANYEPVIKRKGWARRSRVWNFLSISIQTFIVNQKVLLML